MTVSVEEGMEIAKVDNQDNKYTLVLSSKDNKMYGVCGKDIIKLDDTNEDDYICVGLQSLKDEVQVIRVEDGKSYLMENDFCIRSFISDNIDTYGDEYEYVSMKIERMTREAWETERGMTYFLKVRDIVAEKYDEKRSEKR